MNPLPTDKLELSILLFKRMQNRRLVDGQLSGKIGENIDFEALRTALDNAGLLINAKAANRALESYVASGFFESLDDVLASPARRITAPSRFYLADLDCLYSGNVAESPPVVRHYLAATNLYALLAKEADHQGGVGEAKTLVFLHKEKIEITPNYATADLQELQGLNAFESDFITSETHEEQKRTIVKTVLVEMFSEQKKLPFSKLLACFDEFFEKIRASYQLYVAEFSFQKVKAEVEKEKLDAMVKLNKVFSDIQSQLLAVPVALVLVGGQMEDKGVWVSKNVLIWLGAMVFSILMDMLIRNQRHTLKAVKHEIDQQRQQIASKYQAVASRFESAYQEIDERHIHQQRLISVVDLLVAGCLFITTVLLFVYSGACALNP